MASKKKSDNQARGAALIKKAIEAAKASGVIETPEPVPASALKKLKLPNDEKISPAMKEMLAFDASWLGWEIDEEEPEFEPMTLDEFVEQEYGEDSVGQFGEAVEMLGEDCIVIGDGGSSKQFLYVGTPDDKGEYAVITLSNEGGCWVQGYVPFDIWVARQLGAIEGWPELASVPEQYEPMCKALADANGDGRITFKSESREIDRDGDDDSDDDDDDSDDDDDESDDEPEGGSTN